MCPKTKDALEELTICVQELVTACLDEKIEKLVSLTFSLLKTYSQYYWCEGVPNLIAVTQQQEFPGKAASIFLDNSEGPLGYFKGLLKSDKECDDEKRFKVFRKKVFLCASDIGERFMDHFREDINTVTSIPLCKMIQEIFQSCFDSNTCFSQREMDLIRGFLSTFHGIEAESLLQIADNSSVLMKGLIKSLMLSTIPTISRDQTRTVGLVLGYFDLVVDDYSRENCRTNLKKFSFIDVNTRVAVSIQEYQTPEYKGNSLVPNKVITDSLTTDSVTTDSLTTDSHYHRSTSGHSCILPTIWMNILFVSLNTIAINFLKLCG